MPKPYKQLTQEERELIAHLLSEGSSLGDIAKAIGRHKSTVSRELARNSPPERRRYAPCRAHARVCERKTTANTHERLKNDFIRQYVRDGLEKGWSPEQISGRIQIDHPGHSINHEAIYQHIYHPQNPNHLEMITLLRRAHKKRGKKSIGRKERKTKIPNRIPIDARPKSVENRRRYGHWEGDSLLSRKSKAALNTLTERKSRLVLITKLPRKGAAETNKAIINRLRKLSATGRQTLTLDNGTENAKHEQLSAKLGIKCYFAHPYASWERGTNENIKWSHSMVLANGHRLQ
jgi:IS30 family transposase